MATALARSKYHDSKPYFVPLNLFWVNFHSLRDLGLGVDFKDDLLYFITLFFKVKKKEKKKKEKQKKKKSRRAPSSSSSESSESDHRHKVATSVNKNNCIHMYSTQH